MSEDKTEKLGDFMRRVKDDTVLNLYFVTETGSKRIPTPLFGNPTAEQLRDNRYLQSQVVASRKHYCNEVISSDGPSTWIPSSIRRLSRMPKVDRGWRICGRRFGFLGTRRLP